MDCLAAGRTNHSLGIAARDGSICVFDIEKQSTRASRTVNLEEDGTPVQLHFQVCTIHIDRYCEAEHSCQQDGQPGGGWNTCTAALPGMYIDR